MWLSSVHWLVIWGASCRTLSAVSIPVRVRGWRCSSGWPWLCVFQMALIRLARTVKPPSVVDPVQSSAVFLRALYSHHARLRRHVGLDICPFINISHPAFPASYTTSFIHLVFISFALGVQVRSRFTPRPYPSLTLTSFLRSLQALRGHDSTFSHAFYVPHLLWVSCLFVDLSTLLLQPTVSDWALQSIGAGNSDGWDDDSSDGSDFTEELLMGNPSNVVVLD